MRELDCLFVRWKQAHESRGYDCFIRDGIVNEDSWKKAKPRICLFLKEAYSREGESWDLAAWLNDGAVVRMWNTVAHWIYGIQNTAKDRIPKFIELEMDQKRELLQTISVVNTKKSNGRSKSEYEELLNFAVQDREFLREELAIIEPEIIVCGYTTGLLRAVYGATVAGAKICDDGLIDHKKLQKDGYCFMGDKIILDYYHPANQFPRVLNYYTICCLYQQALIERELL